MRCWGWTPPGVLDAAFAYGPALIADVELKSTNKIRPDAGWTGDEVEAAEQLAPLVGGVTSHGFVHRPLRRVLEAFARAGAVAYPQVFDSDQSTEPVAFLRKCVQQYQRAGFREVRPLLGVRSGLPHMVAWLTECKRAGLQPDLWQLDRVRALGLCDNAHNNKTDPPSLPFPLPRPPPGLPPISLTPTADGFGLVLLLVGGFLLYSRKKL